MESDLERYERWVPIIGLPEAPLRDFDCRFEDCKLNVLARYASTGEARRLSIEFDYVEAFKAYEEFSDPWMASGLPLPQVIGEDDKWRYPLQEVMHSSWVARVTARNGGIDRPWRHFVISTMDFSLHVLTNGPPLSVELS
ncbi:hypothetical protein GGQ88_001663 [Novosphingobium hassiacum]|uniref:Uncharacterized protein n=1 Tax=Novosphingobium hassiacum TaxID=173676 RepID=A0A7W5ZVZ8_9SPHN|nr:hypothetical protein [Novosphingobium hassiacum]MBB3860397.1 hypothetical protein [Novosphingobium hassiacum]